MRSRSASTKSSKSCCAEIDRSVACAAEVVGVPVDVSALRPRFAGDLCLDVDLDGLGAVVGVVGLLLAALLEGSDEVPRAELGGVALQERLPLARVPGLEGVVPSAPNQGRLAPRPARRPEHLDRPRSTPPTSSAGSA